MPEPGGDVAVSCEELTTWIDVAAALPKATVGTGDSGKSAPVTVTEVPPLAGPLVGATAVTVGAVRVTSAIDVPQLLEPALLLTAEYSPATHTWSGASASTAAPE